MKIFIPTDKTILLLLALCMGIQPVFGQNTEEPPTATPVAADTWTGSPYYFAVIIILLGMLAFYVLKNRKKHSNGDY